jgi:hypothetical protein
MIRLLEAGPLINPSLEGREKGRVSKNFLQVTGESSGWSVMTVFAKDIRILCSSSRKILLSIRCLLRPLEPTVPGYTNFMDWPKV